MSDIGVTISDEGKQVIALVQKRLTTLYDPGTMGEPFAQGMEAWDDDLWATLFVFALGSLNSYIQSNMNLTLENYPLTDQGAAYALQLALLIETIRQLMMSYVEQPDVSNADAPYANRRDYLQRWEGILTDLQRQLEQAAQKLTIDFVGGAFTKGFKLIYNIRSLPLGGPSFGHGERPIPWFMR